MRSEFERLLKQHRDALTDELVKLGKHRQAQLAEWDIEQNESDYEFYFNAGWNAQQSKVDELQKRVDSTLKVVQSMRNEVKHGHLSDDESQTLSGYANDLEQALKGGSDESN